MQTAAERARYLLERVSLKELAPINSKAYIRWQNIKRGRARLGIEEAEALAQHYPQYALWLIAGTTLPEAGQIAPLTCHGNDVPTCYTSRVYSTSNGAYSGS